MLILSNPFTFHYGPIQMGISTAFLLTNSRFTFHYGPIQIQVEFNDDVLKDIFTFHYGPIQITCHHVFYTFISDIYIPLWSYSNIFQFFIVIFFEDLHSTMVLFKSKQNIKSWKWNMNLHSTMVLFK